MNFNPAGITDMMPFDFLSALGVDPLLLLTHIFKIETLWAESNTHITSNNYIYYGVMIADIHLVINGNWDWCQVAEYYRDLIHRHRFHREF